VVEQQIKQSTTTTNYNNNPSLYFHNAFCSEPVRYQLVRYQPRLAHSAHSIARATHSNTNQFAHLPSHFPHSFSAILSLAALASGAVIAREDTHPDTGNPAPSPTVLDRRAGIPNEPPRSTPSIAEPTGYRNRSFRVVGISTAPGAYWHFFFGQADRALSCDKQPGLVQFEALPLGPSDPAFTANHQALQWPGGEYKVEVFGQNCVYRNDGKGAGRLFCKKEVPCAEHSMRRVGDLSKFPKCVESGKVFHLAVYCDW
jgi:hypothetical protein